MIEKEQLKSRIFDLLVADEVMLAPNSSEKLRKSLDFLDDEEYLQRVLEVTEVFDPEDWSTKFEYWAIAEALRGRDKIEIAHRNINLMRSGTNMNLGFSSVNTLHRSIAEHRNPERPRTVVVERMDSHIAVWNTLRKTHLFEDDGRDMDHYSSNYSDIVSRHPDNPERLAQYLLERGTANFEDEGYAEYLKINAPLAEGTL